MIGIVKEQIKSSNINESLQACNLLVKYVKKPQTSSFALQLYIELFNDDFPYKSQFIEKTESIINFLMESSPSIKILLSVYRNPKIKRGNKSFITIKPWFSNLDVTSYKYFMEKATESFKWNYIELRVGESSHDEAVPCDLYIQVKEFLKSKPQKLCFIIGNSGSGKSLFCKFLCLRLLNNLDSEYFPLFISYYWAILDHKNLIEDLLEEYSINIDYEHLWNKKILFILDGFDNFSSNADLVKFYNIIEKLPNSKIIITWRYSLENSQKLIFNKFCDEIYELYIKPLNNQQIINYIKNYLKKEKGYWINYEAALYEIHTVHKLHKNLRNPFLLNALMSKPNIINTLKNHKTLIAKKSEIFKAVIENLIFSSENFDSQSYDSIRSIYLKTLTKFSLGTFKGKPLEIKNSEWTPILSLITKSHGCPLNLIKKTESSRFYSFTQTSFIDYFISCQIIDDIQIWKDVEMVQESYFNQVNFIDKIEIIQFIRDIISESQFKIFEIIGNSWKDKENLQIAFNNSQQIFISIKQNFCKYEYLDKILNRKNQKANENTQFDMWKSKIQFKKIIVAKTLYKPIKQNPAYNSQKYLILGMQFSPDGQIFCLFRVDWNIIVISLKTFKKIWSIKVAENFACLISPCSKYICVGNPKENLKLWSIDKKELFLEINNSASNEKGTMFTFSYCGKTLAYTNTTGLIIFRNLESSEEFYLVLGEQNIKTFTFTETGNLFFVGNSEGFLRVYELENKTLIYTLVGHGTEINSIFIDPNNDFAVTISYDSVVKMWDLNKRTLLKIISSKSSTSLTRWDITDDGRYFIALDEGRSIGVTELLTDSNQNHADIVNTSVTAIKICPDNNGFIACNIDGSFIFYDLTTFFHYREEKSDEDDDESEDEQEKQVISTIKFSKINNLLASGSHGGQIKIWKIDTMEKIAEISAHKKRIKTLCFSDDNRFLASCSRKEKNVKLWSLESYELISEVNDLNKCNVYSVPWKGFWILDINKGVHVIDLGFHTKIVDLQEGIDGCGECTSATVSPLGNLLAVNCNYIVEIWIINDGDAWKLTELSDKSYNISSISFSYCEKYLATSTYLGKIIIWDLESNEKIMQFKQPGSNKRKICFSPCSQYFAIFNGAVSVISLETKTVTYEIGDASRSTKLHCFSPCGNFLVTTNEDILKIWKFKDATKITTICKPIKKNHIKYFTFSKTGNIISLWSDEIIRIFSFPEEELLYELIDEGKELIFFCLSPNELILISVPDWKPILTIWSLETYDIIIKIETKEHITAIEFSPCGRYFACGGRGSGILYIYDLENIEGEEIAIKTGLQEIRSIRFSRCGKYIACSYVYIQLWDRTTQITTNLIAYDAESLKIRFSECNKCLASACSDGSIRIWNIESMEIISILKAHEEVATQNPFNNLYSMFGMCDLIAALEYSKCGRYLLSAGSNGRIRVFDTVAQNIFYEIKAHMQNISSACFSPDGEWIISSGGGGIRLWNFKQMLAKKKHILKIEKSECGKLIKVSEDLIN